MSSVDLYKGQVSLLLDKTGYVSEETRPKFIDSQNFYFHFHYKLFCFNAVHLPKNYHYCALDYGP